MIITYICSFALSYGGYNCNNCEKLNHKYYIINLIFGNLLNIIKFWSLIFFHIVFYLLDQLLVLYNYIKIAIRFILFVAIPCLSISYTTYIYINSIFYNLEDTAANLYTVIFILIFVSITNIVFLYYVIYNMHTIFLKHNLKAQFNLQLYSLIKLINMINLKSITYILIFLGLCQCYRMSLLSFTNVDDFYIKFFCTLCIAPSLIIILTIVFSIDINVKKRDLKDISLKDIHNTFHNTASKTISGKKYLGLAFTILIYMHIMYYLPITELFSSILWFFSGLTISYIFTEAYIWQNININFNFIIENYIADNFITYINKSGKTPTQGPSAGPSNSGGPNRPEPENIGTVSEPGDNKDESSEENLGPVRNIIRQNLANANYNGDILPMPGNIDINKVENPTVKNIYLSFLNAGKMIPPMYKSDLNTDSVQYTFNQLNQWRNMYLTDMDCTHRVTKHNQVLTTHKTTKYYCPAGAEFVHMHSLILGVNMHDLLANLQRKYTCAHLFKPLFNSEGFTFKLLDENVIKLKAALPNYDHQFEDQPLNPEMSPVISKLKEGIFEKIGFKLPLVRISPNGDAILYHPGYVLFLNQVLYKLDDQQTGLIIRYIWEFKKEIIFSDTNLIDTSKIFDTYEEGYTFINELRRNSRLKFRTGYDQDITIRFLSKVASYELFNKNRHRIELIVQDRMRGLNREYIPIKHWSEDEATKELYQKLMPKKNEGKIINAVRERNSELNSNGKRSLFPITNEIDSEPSKINSEENHPNSKVRLN